MIYCEACRQKQNWPKGATFKGPCELCDHSGPCSRLLCPDMTFIVECDPDVSRKAKRLAKEAGTCKNADCAYCKLTIAATDVAFGLGDPLELLR